MLLDGVVCYDVGDDIMFSLVLAVMRCLCDIYCDKVGVAKVFDGWEI